MDQDHKSGVEKLKDKLYSRKEAAIQPDIRTPLESHPATDVPPAWQEPEAPASPPPSPSNGKPPMSFTSKFFFGSILFFVLAASISAIVFFNGGNIISPQNIDLQIVAPSLIDGGTPSTFQIIATNRNQSDLILVDMVVDYPDGTRSAEDPSKSLSHERQSIGTIKSGQQIKRTASAIFFGQEGLPQKVKVSLEYSVQGSNATFEKQGEVEFTLGSSPVSIEVDAPSEAISGDEFQIKVLIRSNADTQLNNVVLQGQYPFGYSVAGATPSADAGGTLWRLGTLNPGDTKTITLRGSIQGQDGDERVFRFQAGSNNDQTDTQIKVPFLTMPHTLTVHKPFVSGVISVEGQTGKTVPVAAGKVLQGTVRWENNLTDSIADAELVLTFNGPALDKTSVKASNGFYQSTNNSIIWSKDQDPNLANVPPGGSGTYQFSFATLPPGAGNVLITNPTISLNLQVRGTRVGQTSVPESIGSAATLNVQLASAASITAQTAHFSGPFQNTGPMPPRAEVATTYTIIMTVKNSSNALANTTATTVLPPYVQFVSAIPGEGVTYDEASRTVRWPLGELKAGVGYTSGARQAAFQVTLIPSLSQVGQAPTLTGPVNLSGTDRFAQVTVNAEAPAPTTKISGEGGFTTGMDIVAPKQ